MHMDVCMVTKRRLFRVGERVVLAGPVAYPCLVGEGDGVLTFNQTYAQAAERFLSQGLEMPAHMASQAYESADNTSKYAFVRRQISCQMTAEILGQDDLVALKKTASKKLARRIARWGALAGADGCILKVDVVVSSNIMARDVRVAEHFWCLPWGWMERWKE